MSLATRCTACGTVFRVVQDQLKVSEGWVRCGRCSEVFNALEGLFDLERDTPPAFAPAAEAETIDPVSAPVEAVAAPTAVSSSPGEIDKIDAQLMGSRESGHDSTPATRISERDRLEFPDAQFDPDMQTEDTVAPQALATEPFVDEGPAATRTVDQTDEPEFVQRAQRRARWNTPAMRALQTSAVVVLMVGLALQGAHHFRDLVAARWPDTSPALAWWCGVTACAIEAPRLIDEIAVESTALARTAQPEDAFRLSVVLRNRSAMPVALPSVDLSLTDANGQLISRRVLSPADFRVPGAPMRPGAESALQLVLSAGGARVTGYTVEVFYP